MAIAESKNSMSPKERLLYDLKYLREEKADIEYHIRKLEKQICRSDKDIIESFELCARALSPNRVKGAPDADRHDKTLEIIASCEKARLANEERIVELKKRHERNESLINAILNLPYPYRSILTAKYIEGKKEGCICMESRISKSNIYRVISEGVSLLLK